jgi:hypothetical protein
VRLLLELFAAFFAITTIYRRLIQPFLEGMKGNRKQRTGAHEAEMKFKTSASKKNIKPVDPKEIQDAEFEEIK